MKLQTTTHKWTNIKENPNINRSRAQGKRMENNSNNRIKVNLWKTENNKCRWTNRVKANNKKLFFKMVTKKLSCTRE